jgi:thioredoxin-related protein
VSLDHVKSMIIVFAMPGCEACEDYKPRFARQVDAWISHGVPMYWFESGQVPPRMIPVLMLDASSEDPSVVGLADQYEIQAVPTTLLLTRNRRPVKLEGALDDQQIHEILASAHLANR